MHVFRTVLLMILLISYGALCSSVELNKEGNPLFQCETPSGLINNEAVDENACIDTGVWISWVRDPGEWGDGGIGLRSYDILRDGAVIAGGLTYGITTYIDTGGSINTAYTYSIRYNNGCSLSSVTEGTEASNYVASEPVLVENNSVFEIAGCKDLGVRIRWFVEKVQWGDHDIGPRTYDVLRNGLEVATYIHFKTIYFIDTTGTNGQTYLYSVRFRNGCGLTAETAGAYGVDNTCILVSDKPAVDDSGCESPNGIIEPNEFVNLTGLIHNTGTIIAPGVYSDFITFAPIIVENSHAIFPDIEAGSSETCLQCYRLVAPAKNRPTKHWDFTITEYVNCNGCEQVSNTYTYHVGRSFTDVPPFQLFYSYIEALFHEGIASGCNSTNYCPQQEVLRQQLAKFICLAMETVQEGACPLHDCEGLFADVTASNPFCSHIEALSNAGIVSGCQSSPLLFCPGNPVRRQEMAKFICLAMEHVIPGSCQATECTGIFDDVDSNNPFCPYIEALYNLGIISGCSATSYCPMLSVKRDQMSKFLVNAFGISLHAFPQPSIGKQ